jgi:hypothetical protein
MTPKKPKKSIADGLDKHLQKLRDMTPGHLDTRSHEAYGPPHRLVLWTVDASLGPILGRDTA